MSDTLKAAWIGLAFFNWDDYGRAAQALKESTELLAPLAKQNPRIYGSKQRYLLFFATQATVLSNKTSQDTP